MELIVISGRSGSGKSTALHQLEDLGYYCVDNLPAALLPTLTLQLERDQYDAFRGVAVCIDARNSGHDLAQIHEVLTQLPKHIDSEVIFLDASDSILTKRFSETRRRHPLSNSNTSLAEAIAKEAQLLDPLSTGADLIIDTSNLTLYDLRAEITNRLGGDSREGLSLLIESFGFKHGVPPAADLVFDARLLPNPHWVPNLRSLTGLDEEVAVFLVQHEATVDFGREIIQFLTRWLPSYAASQRSYMTVAIGCTGGQHRSVYLAETIYAALIKEHPRTQIRHRELSGMETK